MTRFSTILLTFVAMMVNPGLAQTTVLNITVPGLPPQGIVASGISADATMTELGLGCVNNDTCYLPPGAKVRYGSKTVELWIVQTVTEQGPPATATNIVACDFKENPAGVCTRTIIQIAGNSTSSTAVAGTITGGAETAFIATGITVTAGLENLTPKPAVTSSTGPSQTGGSPPASTTPAPAAAPRMAGGAMMAGLVAVAGAVVFV